MGTILRCSKRTSFLRILTQIELLLQFRAHFADLVFQLFNILKCKSGSRYCLVDTRKNKGFVPESVLTREFTRFRPLTLPNYLMMGLT